MEGDFIWLRVLHSRAIMTAAGESVVGVCLLCSFSHPSGWAEERRQKRIRACDCLSRRRVRARPLFRRAPQVAPLRSAGAQTIGSLFSLLTFFLATQKESELLPGNPRLAGKLPHREQRKQSVTMHPGSSPGCQIQLGSAINSIASCDRRARATALKRLQDACLRLHRREGPTAHGIPAAAAPARH